jgi:hypothetical protein
MTIIIILLTIWYICLINYIFSEILILAHQQKVLCSYSSRSDKPENKRERLSNEAVWLFDGPKCLAH